MTLPALDRLLSDEGWPSASSLPTGADDPGRFHALFGRDSLITSLQVLPARPDVARATLRALAQRQGRRDDPATLEAPGKIGHEFRDEPPFAGWPSGEFRYYATADATSWFLVLLDRLGDAALTAELEPAWRAAGELLQSDSVLSYGPGSRGGLSQQGWRDCVDPLADGNGGGTVRTDGTAPRAPMTDADSNAVAVAALAAYSRLSGEPDQSAAMRAEVTGRFLPDVVMIDADGPIRAAGSQLGWLLWADAIEPASVDAVAERLAAPDICTDFGLRTLSADAPGFAAENYHRGSVWPFDSWLGWGGLRAAGRLDAAERVRTGVLDAVTRLGGYPELYAVPPGRAPERVAAANRVQAWTVGAVWALEHEWDGRGRL